MATKWLTPSSYFPCRCISLIAFSLILKVNWLLTKASVSFGIQAKWPSYNFDGFQMLFRVHAPGAGRVTILFKAESDAQIFEAFAPWRAQFGIEMDFTPVIGCQDVVDYHKKLFAKMS